MKVYRIYSAITCIWFVISCCFPIASQSFDHEEQRELHQQSPHDGLLIPLNESELKAVEHLKSLEESITKTSNLLQQEKHRIQTRHNQLPPKKQIVLPERLAMQTDEALDQEYAAFIKTTYPDIDMNKVELGITEDPLAYLQGRGVMIKNGATFTPGKYGKFASGPWYIKLAPEFYTVDNKGKQGWKIHITARPRSALKIARIVLPILNSIQGLQGSFVSHKIVASLPLLRMQELFIYAQNYETQAGKYLVIYPDNDVHAYNLVKEIDRVLVEAIRQGILTKSDFLPLVGDAKIGYSGGVYARYGTYSGGNFIRSFSPSGVSKYTTTEEDNRFFPWPNFMNKRYSDWREAVSPFHELPIQWKSYPSGELQISSWESRPDKW